MKSVLLLLVSWSGIWGQSLIVGIPGSDVAPKGEFSLAHESQGYVFESGGYWNSFTFATYGLGNGWELASSLYGLSRPSTSELALGMGFKKRFLVRGKWAKRHELAVAGGAMVPVSCRGNRVGLWAYGLASVRLPGTRTRLTGGPSWGTRQVLGGR